MRQFKVGTSLSHERKSRPCVGEKPYTLIIPMAYGRLLLVLRCYNFKIWITKHTNRNTTAT